ncbi:MAG: 4-hydroxy-tetrahydrodipicolinate reductase [Lachnoanaerobaculum sp.]|jgi:dihydrodipicolinate reductase|uniref:4-hydroxy-tetrahydrodipicolinate reductase n=1 Tax=Lachnoanaerobaculum sp. OBRC5-5 TaxID=936595 RepID=UPI00028256C9|nr:4-hydroxy-tetrahydrodipicolinate reductase [Lachnoanaerobaculum sp. OBRC5-5]EJZ70220.1 dihydrodipicolinate reductase [Lachnoanaerobaculum sp. OBRC5-5]MDU6629537.1 4-hydroxy-tetrahydrodipicolinate reductase [Lachnoanaerobaculum sp.]
MTKIILNGANGAMGKVVSELIALDSTVEIVAGVDLNTDVDLGFPVFDDIRKIDIEADAVIDFASVKAVDNLLDFIEEKKIPAVICTTGLSEEQIGRINELSKNTAILRSANMSLGINTLSKVLAQIAPTLRAAGFDIEIVEAHHRRKLDAPSGTAILLADAVNENMDEKLTYTYDRSKRHEPRRADEIGLSAVRGGTIVGDHDVIFAGEDEVITLSHRAYSRKIFANGAISAAKFLQGKTAGLYDMSDVI